VLDRFDAPNRVLDGVVTSTPTQTTLQDARQILAVLLTQAGRCHDHPRRAETALEPRCIEESALHRVQFPVLRESFNGRYLMAFGAKRRDQPVIHRHAAEPHRARPAVASITPFFDAEPAHLA